MTLSSILSPAEQNDELTLVIGTYNNPNQPGIFSFYFDQTNAHVEPLDSFNLRNPSYLTFGNDGNLIFAVSELSEDNSTISTLSLNRESGAFEEIDRKFLTGSPCYVSVLNDMAYTANYGGGSVNAVKFDSQGKILSVEEIFKGGLGGPDGSRQNLPHVHCVIPTPDNSGLIVSDFSADKLYFLSDGKTPRAIKVNKDTGPRHIVFDKKGEHAYMIGELSGDVTVFGYENGDLRSKQVVTADSVHERASADIHISPDGQHLYVSNRRKNDGLSIFEINSQDGSLTYVGYQHTGPHPRHFNITPNGKYVLVACRDNNSIEIYLRDPTTGLLSPTGQKIEIPKPVNVQFAPNK